MPLITQGQNHLHCLCNSAVYWGCKGEACSHVAALLFYIEDIKRREGPLPLDKTVTDQLQQWHVPPQRTVTPQPLLAMHFWTGLEMEEVKDSNETTGQLAPEVLSLIHI